MSDSVLREQLARLLGWGDAHATFEDAVQDIPPEMRGQQPAGLPYSPWQLVEHLRIAQADILAFCQDAEYVRPRWPDDYWPATAAPPSHAAWQQSVAAFQADRDALRRLAAGPTPDLCAPVPNGNGPTYLRELLLAADHAAYHVGELIVVRRLLGVWPGG